MVRNAAFEAIPKWVSMVDDLYEGIPSIVKSTRNSESNLGRLKEIYPLTIRKERKFYRSLIRRESQLSSEREHENLPVTLKTPYIDRNTLNAQRKASYYSQLQENQASDLVTATSGSLYHITELPVTDENFQPLSDNYNLKERSRRGTEDDVDLELRNLRI